jgi:hypothetical protein
MPAMASSSLKKCAYSTCARSAFTIVGCTTLRTRPALQQPWAAATTMRRARSTQCVPPHPPLLLTPLQAVLALFNSLGCGSPAPPSSQATAQVFEHENLGAEGESQPSLQDLDHLVPHLGRVDLHDDRASHGGQQGAVHADYAAAASVPHADAPACAAAASPPPAAGLMSAASAGDRACIREWMQVQQAARSL